MSTKHEPAVQRAIALMQAEPAAAFLSDAKEVGGKCFTAARAFLAALEQEGAPGLNVQFGGQGGFHQLTVIADGPPVSSEAVVVDWTARQFDADAEWPRIETLQATVERYGEPTFLDDDFFLWFANSVEPSDHPSDWTWDEAKQRLAAARRDAENSRG